MSPVGAENSQGVDLSTCDREPIHIPGSIQPHGALLAVHPGDYTVLQASANVEGFLGRPVDLVLGRPVGELLGSYADGRLKRAVGSGGVGREPTYVGTVPGTATGGASLNVTAHRAAGGVVVLELEAGVGAGEDAGFRELYPAVQAFVGGLREVADVGALCERAAAEARRITGFDRVLIYRFDADGAGTVVGEARDPAVYESFMGHRFPASDIPAQAREMYRLNRFRLIADAGYAPVPVLPATNPLTGGPLDMTFAALRSVSPVHVEYLRNMGVAASMSVSVLREGRLWGLISFHHKGPRNVPPAVRSACDFLGQMFALHLDATERAAEFEHRMGLKAVHGRLLGHMAVGGADFADALLGHGEDLLRLTGASGAVVAFDGKVGSAGRVPGDGEVARIIAWLAEAHAGEGVFQTDSLAGVMAGAEAFAEVASGVMAVSVSELHRSYVIWFRPEVVRTVTWGGDPRKAAGPAAAGGLRLHPRTSFEAWRETVRLRSLPWRPSEVEAAGELRGAIVGIVLRAAEERAALSAELDRSNKELEAFSYSVSHDLRAPFRHIVGYAELLRDRIQGRAAADADELRYIDTIVESARFSGSLVDNLLAFSQMGRSSLKHGPVDMGVLVEEVRGGVMEEAGGRSIEWRVGELPRVAGDLNMLRQVVQNLLSNAVKYTRDRAAARIEVGAREEGSEWVFEIADNGIGFDMRYVDKLFGVFQRLHRMEDFEGTGIGLANVRRIVTRHGGRTWAEGAPDRGARFFFSLPKNPRTEP